MIRVWPLLVLVALLGGRPTPAFAQLKVTEKEPIKLALDLRSPSVAAFTPDGRTLAVNDKHLDASGDPIGGPYRVRLLDATTGKEQAALRAHSNLIGAMTFNADGSALATWGHDDAIKIWDVKARKQTCVLEGFLKAEFGKLAQGPGEVCFSPDGKTLASVGGMWAKNYDRQADANERIVRLWDIATGKQRAQLVADGPVNALGYRPDGKALLLCETNVPSVWNTETEEPQKRADRRPQTPYFAYSHDSKLYASHGGDGIEICDATTFKEKVRFNPGELRATRGRLSFSPDAKLLVVEDVSGQAVELYGVETGKRLATLERAMFPIAFSQDGKTLKAVGKTPTADKKGEETAIRTWELTWEKAPAK